MQAALLEKNLRGVMESGTVCFACAWYMVQTVEQRLSLTKFSIVLGSPHLISVHWCTVLFSNEGQWSSTMQQCLENFIAVGYLCGSKHVDFHSIKRKFITPACWNHT
jgi:hypothetical protein